MLHLRSLFAALALTGAGLNPGAALPAGAPGPAPTPLARGAGDDDPTPERLAKLAEGVAPALVRVQYTLKYDKGDAPGAGSMLWAQAYRALMQQDESESPDLSQLVRDERPLERAGYLLADGRVVTSDPCIHPRFIAQIAVRAGERTTPATIEAYGRAQGALLLRLREPIPGGLAFDGDASGPLYSIGYAMKPGGWTIGAGPGPGGARVEPASGRTYQPAPSEVLLVDRAGKAVGLSFAGELPLDGSWKGSPGAWDWMTTADMQQSLADLEKAAALSLPRVEIRFRSPRSGAGDGGGGRSRRFGMGDESADEQATEWNGSGILAGPTTVVVLGEFKPKLTARLESIQVFGPGNTPVRATFMGTLKDYGALVATLEAPMSGVARLATTPAPELRRKLLLKAEVSVLGESRTAYFWRERIDLFRPGWKGRLYPASPATRGASMPWESEGYSAENFLFDLSGALVAVPIGHREKVGSDDRYNFRQQAEVMLPAPYLAEVLAQRDGSYDPENRPLAEAEEDRLAWLGVELQAMDPDLARVNNVVDQTGGGRTGAAVTYLYAESPAARAGIKVGDILLRMHVAGLPKPLDVQIRHAGGGFMDDFWSMYDRLPEDYFDEIPEPWGSAENALTRALTDIGFGTPFTADIYRDGKVLSLDMAVTQGPAYYGSAKRFKSDPAGLTVRDLTYEVRRYFQLKPEDPGVILSKIEKGGRAAIAGLRPYEIITAIDDRPVTGVRDVEMALASGAPELRLSVKRMTEGRIVKLKIGGADRNPKTSPAPKDGPGADDRK